MPIISIPEILREKLTPKGAEALIEVFNEVEANSKDRTLEVVEERFEKRLAQVGAEIRNELVEIKSGLNAKIEKVESGLKSEIRACASETKTDVIRWVVGAVMAHLAILLAIFAIFFK